MPLMLRLVMLASFVGLLSISGCGKEERPLSRDEIYKARQEIPTLYLTANGDEVVAPGNERGVIVHPDTNVLAFQAYVCNNPDCPGEGSEDRPYVFTKPDPMARVGADSTVEFKMPEGQTDFDAVAAYADLGCPACEEIRNRESETPKQRQMYDFWVQPYVLPEATERLAELDEAYEAALERIEKRNRELGIQPES